MPLQSLSRRANALARPKPARRTFANQLPRPPPKALPPPETFSATARPRQYYSRPHQRDLPPYRVSTPPTATSQYILTDAPLSLSAHGQVCLRRACAASAHGRRSWRTLRTRNVCRARRCGACSASCAKAQMCVLYLATLCVLNLHGTSTGVHGYTARYVHLTLFFSFPHHPPLLSLFFFKFATCKRGKAGMV